VALLAVGLIANRVGDQHPRPDSIFYVLDADRQSAVWATMDATADGWTAQFLGSAVAPAALAPPLRTFVPGRYLQAAAPVVAIAPPEAAVLADTISNGVRELKLRIASSRAATTLAVYLENGGAVEEAWVDGVALAPSHRTRLRADDVGAGALRGFLTQRRWGLIYHAPGAAVDLALRIRAAGALRFYVVDKSDGIPEALDTFKPRPPWLMPSPAPLGLLGRTRDSVIVAKSYFLSPPRETSRQAR
jgi:hypothetical protein